MYKLAIRTLIKRNIAQLNAGDFSSFLAMAAPDMTIAFPGVNSWSTMFRPVELGRLASSTHRGIEECTAFGERFVDEGVQFELEDILIAGPPWNTRIALRVQSFVPAADGTGPDEYNNRAIALLEVRWGKLSSWEDYEDTQRVAAWDLDNSEATSVSVST